MLSSPILQLFHRALLQQERDEAPVAESSDGGADTETQTEAENPPTQQRAAHLQMLLMPMRKTHK